MNAVAGVFLLELNEVDAALLLVTLRSVCVYVSAQVCLCLCVCVPNRYSLQHALIYIPMYLCLCLFVCPAESVSMCLCVGRSVYVSVCMEVVQVSLNPKP